MAWDEWEQLKHEAAQRHGTQMQLNQYLPGDGPAAPSTSAVTAGLQSNKQAWNKAGEGVGGLREGLGKALTRLTDGQQGADAAGCLTAGAQKDVYSSWARYVRSVDERCGSVKEALERAGHDLLRTDDAVRGAFTAIDSRYADTHAVGGQAPGR
ncbi:hypothetical protein PUR28_20430 [Streptomyces sp. BE308]|uniref:hypothetical protein n=1 Tax=unclassified Streptomyces TaxID=2593676 RepID=UPI002DD95C74|nr:MULTISPECIES: hypothetical protein [unclassified Streptomyces]MEE1793091.1 hypothetical protein [Streptomyces sp. BE308]WRZ74227.1 hypothetical protein OG251_22865 [Streptomyces sp. NBC_01237]